MSKYVNEVAKLAYGYAILHEAIEENKNSAAKTAAIGAGAGIAGGMLSQTQGFKNFTANAANGMRRMMQPPQGQPGQAQQPQTASAQSGVNAAVASGNAGVIGGGNNPGGHHDVLNQQQTTTQTTQPTTTTASAAPTPAQTPAPQQNTNATSQTPVQGQAVGGNTQPQVAQPVQTQTPTVPQSTSANQAASTAGPSGSNVPVDANGLQYGVNVNGKVVPISGEQYDRLTSGNNFNVDLPASMQAQSDRVKFDGPSVNNAAVQRDINAGTFTDPNDPKYLNQIDRAVYNAQLDDEINKINEIEKTLNGNNPGFKFDSNAAFGIEPSTSQNPSFVTDDNGMPLGSVSPNGQINYFNMGELPSDTGLNGATIKDGRLIVPDQSFGNLNNPAATESAMRSLLQQDSNAVQQAYNDMGRLGLLGNKLGVYNPAYNVRTNFNFGNSSDASAASSAAADAASYNPWG